MSEDKQEILLRLCPELATGINEGDVNKHIIAMTHKILVAERHIDVLIERLLALYEENKNLKDQLIRIEPLLRAQEAK